MNTNLIAQNKISNPVLGPGLSGLTGAQFLGKFIPALITLIFIVGIVLFVFNFLRGAIGWISSGGDKVKLEAARHTLLNAVIGLILLLSMYGIINLLSNFLGFNLTYFDLYFLKLF